MLIIMGCRITERVLKAGKDAITAKRVSRFTSVQIGRVMAPLIYVPKKAGSNTTLSSAATAAAEHLLWIEHKAGRVEALGMSLGRRYWRAVPARLRGCKA